MCKKYKEVLPTQLNGVPLSVEFIPSISFSIMAPILSTHAFIPYLQILPKVFCIVVQDMDAKLHKLTSIAWPSHVLRNFTKTIVDIVHIENDASTDYEIAEGENSSTHIATILPVGYNSLINSIHTCKIIPIIVYRHIAENMPLLSPMVQRGKLIQPFLDCESVVWCEQYAKNLIFPLILKHIPTKDILFLIDIFLAEIPSEWTIVILPQTQTSLQISILSTVCDRKTKCIVDRVIQGTVDKNVLAHFVCKNKHITHLCCHVPMQGVLKCGECEDAGMS